MRFNKPSRKLRIKKKKYKKSESEHSLSFLIYLTLGLILLGLLGFASYKRHGEKLITLRQDKIEEDMERICSAAILYFQDHGQYPLSSQGIALLTKTAPNSQNANKDIAETKYLARLPLDPWKNQYGYQYIEKDNSIILTCWGADRKPGGTGESADIIRQDCPPSLFPPQ